MLLFIDRDQDYYVIHEKSMYGNQNCFFIGLELILISCEAYQGGPLPTAINFVIEL